MAENSLREILAWSKAEGGFHLDYFLPYKLFQHIKKNFEGFTDTKFSYQTHYLSLSNDNIFLGQLTTQVEH